MTDDAPIIRYIGQTRNSLERLKYHLRDAQDGRRSALADWMRSVIKSGHEVKLIVLDDDATWDVSEILWIERVRLSGAPLLNKLRGGNDAKPRSGKLKRHPDLLLSTG